MIIDPTKPLEDLLKDEGVSRTELLERIAALIVLARAMEANLTPVQRRCTALLTELRAYRASGICLPGWWCACGKFNGEAMREHVVCLVCDRPKSSSPPNRVPA